MEVKCYTCEKMFDVPPSRVNAKYCSRECRKVRISIRCIVCNKESERCPSRRRSNEYCSKRCCDIDQSKSQVKHTCKHCNKEFYLAKSFSINRKTGVARCFCSKECRYASDDFFEQARQMNLVLQSRKMTKVEASGYALLEDMGFISERQKLINGKICVDAFIPDCNLIVQFDGDYWHGHPNKFPEPTHRQLKRMSLDVSQDAYLKKCGYKVIRLWESDLKDLAFCREKINSYATTIF